MLTYLRDADRGRYVRELAGLVSDQEIRPHIKELAFALLAEVTDPTEDEWAIWEEWTAPALKAIEEEVPNPNKLSVLAWRRLFGSAPWFDFVDRLGMVESWLASGNDQLTALGMSYLSVHHRHSPDRVAALLEPYTDHGDRWSGRLRNFMQWCELHTSRRLFDLFLRLVDNGVLDEARGPIAENSTFWSMLRNLGKNRPEWASEVLAHRLRRRHVVVRASGEDLRYRELLGHDDAAVELFFRSAKRAPAKFVEHVLPIVLELSDSTLTGDEPPKRDGIWPVLLVKTKHPERRGCLSFRVGESTRGARVRWLPGFARGALQSERSRYPRRKPSSIESLRRGRCPLRGRSGRGVLQRTVAFRVWVLRQSALVFERNNFGLSLTLHGQESRKARGCDS